MDNLPSASLFSRHEFLIRRLQSLSGIVPVGAYMCVHLATNASTLGGADVFQKNVDAIHSLGPLLPLVEWTFIFLPIIFHAAVGIVIVRSGSYNTVAYPYGGNVRYMLQRATAWIALFFIFWHVFHMHGWFHSDWWHENLAAPLGGASFDSERATSSARQALQPVLFKVLYGIGVLSCVYHLANGLWTSGITWGLWTTRAAQRRADYVCTAFGILLAILGLAALVGVSTADEANALAVEQIHIEHKLAELKLQEQLEPSDRNKRELKQLEGELDKVLDRQKQLKQPAGGTASHEHDGHTAATP
ncbi:MAG TPA: succinate dehydrogenase cytochrome b558 subunit [Pirellulales bacterium]|nr:succinate dehydrogenase cytochrome b558 subunit [Pirellulales bacterium]